jgi:hypothetical protein
MSSEGGRGEPMGLLWRFLQIRALFGQDGTLNRTDLHANTAVDTGSKVDPVPVGAFAIFTGAFVNASNRAGINAVGNAFTDIRYDRVGHGKREKG